MVARIIILGRFIGLVISLPMLFLLAAVVHLARMCVDTVKKVWAGGEIVLKTAEKPQKPRKRRTGAQRAPWLLRPLSQLGSLVDRLRNGHSAPEGLPADEVVTARDKAEERRRQDEDNRSRLERMVDRSKEEAERKGGRLTMGIIEEDTEAEETGKSQ